MKNYLYLWITMCVALLTACSSDDPHTSNLPQLNIEQPRYMVAKGTVEIKLVADAPMETDVSIPFTLVGNAAEGTDFTLTAHAFEFKAGQKEAVIGLTRIEESIGKNSIELTLNLDRNAAPQGFRIGLFSYTTIELMGENAVVVTFQTGTGVLTLQSDYVITLEKLDGSSYKVAADTQFDVEVDPSSTAVEGVHYKFTDGAYIRVAKNSNKGSLGLKFLKKEEGHDKLVLRLADKDGYVFGSNRTLILTIQGPDVYTGTWAFKKISNIDYWANQWFEDTSGFPKGTADDQIVFEGDSYESYNFTPHITGDLKNYFSDACKVTFKGEREEIYGEESTSSQVKGNISVLEFERVNVNFSPTKTNYRKAVVGFRLRQIDGEEILECTIYDYEPTDFLTAVYEMYKDFGGYDPVMIEAPLRLHFTRVK